MGEYICKECGATFDTPHEYEERHGFTHGPFEKWSVCPYCGEAGYEEATSCDHCGTAIAKSDVHTINVHGRVLEVCDRCNDELEEESWK